MKKEQTLGIVAVVLFVVGILMIMVNTPTLETIVFGMLLIAVSVITTAYMIHFPAKKVKKRKKPRKKKK